ncbi:MAG: adenylyltransferase/cytidyltransferase family protein [Clostridium sp.]|nr:adenylyltransferase/cytidyltransferase family protein [Clostridium sp.]
MKKYKIGFTVGTYDLFHVGHLNLFREAKKYCEHLIVGVHSDEWVMHCKNRPTVISYEDRADIVSSIKYVDEVVKNETRSKMEAWKEYHFDVAFIGDDWKGTEIWDKIEIELKSVGCDVIYIPYTKGISTTQIRQQLKDQSVTKSEKK